MDHRHGPLTSAPLAERLQELCGNQNRLFFYDAISPILAAESIDMEKGFHGSRYGKGDDDYLNLPMSKAEYDAFIDACIAAEKMPLHDFENTRYFEGCLPIEVMIERGRETLRFGPMKPVGFIDPRTGHRPWANVQLRIENAQRTMYSIVGFQTKMKWPEQKRVFGLIPGLANVEFLRFGSIHRNTYIQSPMVLNPNLSFRTNSRVFVAGQLTGVEGYVESAAMGIVAAHNAAALLDNRPALDLPKTCMLGALVDYVVNGCKGDFQPMNANLGLLPLEEKKRGEGKEVRKERQCEKARQAFDAWAAARNMTANSAGFRDAPPTSAPSISLMANSAAAFPRWQIRRKE